MKFCAVICEYNPFHNGHLHQLREIARLGGCDKILCIMSGNFTQRGEAAVFHKSVRARHAVENGADAVIELPAAFAVSPAELFARGAVHILASIPSVAVLAFGCESGTKESFLTAARALSDESKTFKTALKEAMKDGTSYAKARTQTVLALNTDVDESLLSSPNNLLGVEYCRALLAERSNIEPLPIPRVGGGYADTEVRRDFSSATALRAVLGRSDLSARLAIRRNLPKNVYADAKNYRPVPYETAFLSAFLRASDAEIAATPDCAEGLEHRIRALVGSNPDYQELLSKVATKRYSRARCRRVIAETFLGISEKEVKGYLSSPLYVRTLALKKEGAEETLAELAKGKFPLVVRKSDAVSLTKEAEACMKRELFASALYDVLCGERHPAFETVMV